MANSKVEESKQKLQTITNSIIQDPSINKKTKVQMVIRTTSLVCAIIAAQPIPFADVFVLTPIQLIMTTALNKILGNPFKESSLSEILTSLLGVVGWGALAQHIILGLYKAGLPFISGLTTIPVVYAVTFGLGKCVETMIEAKNNDRKIKDTEMKKIFNDAKDAAKKEQKKMNINDAIKQLSQLSKAANEYNEYKENFLALDKEIRNKYKNDILMQTDINTDILEKKQIIKQRVEKYENIEVNDYILNLMTVLDSKIFIEVMEYVLSDLNFNMEKMNCVSYKSFSNGNFFEIQSPVGLLFVKGQVKNEIINIDFKEQYKNDLLVRYMSGKNQIMQDGEIRQKFNDIINNAKKYVYIVSPWVSKSPYATTSNLLLKAVKRNTNFKIKVLYGYKDNNSNLLDNSRKCIKEYKEKLGNNFQFKETNTHVKLIICDDECYMIGSMNYLSFSGDDYYKNSYENDRVRHEVASLSFDSNSLQELKEAYFNW